MLQTKKVITLCKRELLKLLCIDSFRFDWYGYWVVIFTSPFRKMFCLLVYIEINLAVCSLLVDILIWYSIDYGTKWLGNKLGSSQTAMLWRKAVLKIFRIRNLNFSGEEFHQKSFQGNLQKHLGQLFRRTLTKR